MGLGLDNTLRQKHNTYLFPKSQNDIVKYTFLPLCVWGVGGVRWGGLTTLCWRKYFLRVIVYSYGGGGFLLFWHIAMIFKKYKIKFTKKLEDQG